MCIFPGFKVVRLLHLNRTIFTKPSSPNYGGKGKLYTFLYSAKYVFRSTDRIKEYLPLRKLNGLKKKQIDGGKVSLLVVHERIIR